MSKGNILVVEDSLTQALKLQKLLEDNDFVVALAYNGLEAVEYLHNDKFSLPDLIISDIIMPKMDGFQLASYVKTNFPQIFLIILTAENDEESLKKSFELGAIDFIEKPFTQTELFVRTDNINRIKKAENSLLKTLDKLFKANEILKIISITDKLTGLFNRKHIIDELIRQMHYSARNNVPLCIVMLDIDHFKSINDTYGHLVGDVVLEKIGSVLKKNIRKYDMAGRYGGEEFLIYFPNISLENCVRKAKILCTQIKNLSFESIPDRKITISCGVCEYKMETTFEDFLVRADRLLYKAKDNGRDRVES